MPQRAVERAAGLFRRESLTRQARQERASAYNRGDKNARLLEEARMSSRSSWHRTLALLIIVLVPVLALAAPLWCFASGMW